MTESELVEARFRWAKKHLKTFEREVRAFLRRQPYRLEVQPNRERTEYVFRIRIRERPPEHWPFVISDGVHNLRSTLDNLAFHLAGRPTGKRGGEIEFPIVHPGRKGGRKVFDKAAKKRLAGLHPEAIAIIESVQPYHGLRRPRPKGPKPWPPYPLSVLQYMDNADKHRSPHIGYWNASDISMHSAIPPLMILMTSRRLLEDGAEIGRYIFAEPNMQVSKPTATIQLAFKIPGRYPPLPMDAYLIGMRGLIEADILTPLRPYMK